MIEFTKTPRVVALGAGMISALFIGCASMEGGTATQSPPAQKNPVFLGTGEANVIPTGTEFAIRVTDNIDSNQPVEGKIFRGTMAQDIRANAGNVMVPQGSPVELTVISKTNQPGAFGTPELTLAVRAVSVNGRRYMVSTQKSTQEGDEGFGVNKRTGIYTGGGAAIGTVIGAIAGGTKGAIIGGVLGGAAGAATQVLTQGQHVQVPAGSEITFRLDQAWRLVPETGNQQPVS